MPVASFLRQPETGALDSLEFNLQLAARMLSQASENQLPAVQDVADAFQALSQNQEELKTAMMMLPPISMSRRSSQIALPTTFTVAE